MHHKKGWLDWDLGKRKHFRDGRNMVNSTMTQEEISKELEQVKSRCETLEAQIKELRYKEYLLKMILSNIPQSIYFKDLDGRYTGASKSTFKKFGLADESGLIGQTDKVFYSPKHFEEIRKKEEEIVAYGKPVIDAEVEETWPDETKTFSINSKLPLKDDTGKIIGIFGISNDISGLKESEFALHNNLNFLEVLINTLPSPIFYKDHLGKFQGCNDAFVKLINVSRDNLIGSTVFDIFSEDTAKTLHSMDRVLLKEKGIQNFEVVLEAQNGNVTEVFIHQASFINHDDQIIGLVGGILNISDTHIIEQKLELYTEELKKSNANKDRFFSIIAHDLKNPFITLLGYTEALIEDYYEMSAEEHLAYLTQIQTTSKNSYQLLENLLQWSRSQSGKLKIDPVKFNLNEVVDEVISLKLSACAVKSISLINTLDKNVEVFADKDTVKTIMRNLIGNAIKFTNDNGKITIACEIENKFAKISVIDNGVGINEAEKADIFNIDKFHSTPGTRDEKGTGLGLVLCQEFVTKNGGKIWVESEINHGSKFLFTLPVE